MSAQVVFETHFKPFSATVLCYVFDAPLFSRANQFDTTNYSVILLYEGILRRTYAFY